MQIILVHQRLAQARTLTLDSRHLVLVLFILSLCVIGCAILFDYFLVSSPVASKIPGIAQMAQTLTQGDTARQEHATQEQINAMAIKLGEMQAQLMQLEALGDRVSSLAGINAQEFNLRTPPPRGGALTPGAHDMSLSDFKGQLDSVSQGLERRADYFNVVESALLTARLKSKMMPTSLPVNVEYDSSGFGWRIDPFTGKMAMHEGIDFVAQPGTPIVAAAGGVVIAAEWHHDFGNMVEIDHGNDITTLYAHASRIYVHVGDVVRRGQRIGDVGMTGRATGPHLHFEVHVKGVPQNPAKFLAAAGADTSPAQLASAAAAAGLRSAH